MDRRTLEEHLAQAERHVALGARHLVRQRVIVADLERDGHVAAAATARDLLRQFEDVQALHVSDRDRLRRELGRPYR
jgi:cell division protein FtsX